MSVLLASKQRNRQPSSEQFPGETDEEFAETLEFVKSMHFAGGYIFSYSARPGTPATRMQDQVRREAPSRKRFGMICWNRDYHAIKARSAALWTVLADSAKATHRKFIGKTMPVLWEAVSILTDEGWQIEGLTDNYMCVTAIAAEPRWNQIDHVFLRAASAEGLSGEIRE